MNAVASGPIPSEFPRDARLWRYVFSNDRKTLSGWSIFVLGSDGYFSAVSDYGAYVYLFTHHGRDDFREFFAHGIGADYLLSKIASRVYDGESTLAAVRERICEDRRERKLTKYRAACEMRRLNTYGNLRTEHDFTLWLGDNELDCGDCIRHSYEPMAVSFVERCVKGQLVPRVRLELEQEKRA